MKLSTAAYTILALGAAPAAQGMYYDFRNFEGWWEGLYTKPGYPADTATDPFSFRQTMNVHFNCSATGDWMQAVCDFNIVVPSDEQCQGAPSVVGHKFMLSQFDKESGCVGCKESSSDDPAAIMPSVAGKPLQCCVALIAGDPVLCNVDPNQLPGAPPGDPEYANPNIIFKQLAGKNSRHIRAIEIDFQGNMGDSSDNSGDEDFDYKVEVRRLGGGFKDMTYY